MCLKGVTEVLLNVWNFYLDYRIIMNMKFWSFGDKNILPATLFSKKHQEVRGEIPPVGVWGILGVRNLARRYFDYLNIFQS